MAPTEESLASCGERLQQAIDCMSTLQDQLIQVNPGERSASTGERTRLLRSELMLLRGELSRAGALLSSAAAFHEGWAKLLRPDPASEIDYSPRGRANSFTPARGLSIHG